MNDGGQAFPCPNMGMSSGPEGRTSWEDNGCQGMTLRDWFAGMAMGGCAADTNCPEPAALAKWSYSVADAMILEREKNKENKQ